MRTPPQIVVGAAPEIVKGELIYIGTAQVRYETPDGQFETAFLEFGGRPFLTAAEAKAYAEQAATLRIQRYASPS